MTKFSDLLIEIGCEELPSMSLEFFVTEFQTAFKQQLDKAKLNYQTISSFVTPRRLALLITHLADEQPPYLMKRQGPSATTAFDRNGTPTLACLGFARACGVSTEDLVIEEKENGQWVFCKIESPGKPTVELLPNLLALAIKNIPIVKPMRWGDHSISFIRPVHWVVALYGNQIITTRLLGSSTGGQTYGHRFLHPDPISLEEPNLYPEVLKKAYVLADFAKRKEEIVDQIKKLAATHGKVLLDPILLTEVTGMVEWPEALLGKFDTHFLTLPPEVLITTLKVHQRAFALVNHKDEILPFFITISNIISKNPKEVISGNERVINARLSDAAFFYRQDLKTPLKNYLQKLSTVIFHQKLSHLLDKTNRLSALSIRIAKKIGATSKTIKHAALLSKCDLMSKMVYEFPSLQGVMGYYYALKSGESNEVALAIKEHYYPRFSGDQLPTTPTGISLALADRLDTLVGLFGINQAPSSEKDPFGLRRAGIGILRILLEKKIDLDLKWLLIQAKKSYGTLLSNKKVVKDALSFLIDRLKHLYLEQNIPSQWVEALLANKITAPLDFEERLQALKDFLANSTAQESILTYKRINNLLKKQILPAKKISTHLFDTKSEWELFDALETTKQTITPHLANKKYDLVLKQLFKLKKPIDKFFDHVLVMDENKKKRMNRLLLLAELKKLFCSVFDFSFL